MKNIIIAFILFLCTATLASCSINKTNIQPELIYHMESNEKAPTYSNKSYSFDWIKTKPLDDVFITQHDLHYSYYSIVNVTEENSFLSNIKIKRDLLGSLYFYNNFSDCEIAVYKNDKVITIIFNKEVYTYECDINFDPFNYCVDGDSIYLFAHYDYNLHINRVNLASSIIDNFILVDKFIFTDNLLGDYPKDMGGQTFIVKDDFLYFYTQGYEKFSKLNINTSEITNLSLPSVATNFYLLDDTIMLQQKIIDGKLHIYILDYDLNVIEEIEIDLATYINMDASRIRSNTFNGSNRDIMFNGVIYSIFEDLDGYSYLYCIDINSAEITQYKKIKGEFCDFAFKYNNFDLQAHINNITE